MAEFRVINVVDGDTFDVSPDWKWNGHTGSRVRPAGYDAPEHFTMSGEEAKEKLERIVLGNTVRLGEAYRIDRGRLVCEVFIRGQNLSSYFPEYQ